VYDIKLSFLHTYYTTILIPLTQNYFKKLAAFFVLCSFFITTLCVAQIKEKELSWYSLKWYDDSWWNSNNPHQNPTLKIKYPNWYVKSACKLDDFIKGRNALEKKYLHNAYIKQKDYFDENDKDKVTSVKLLVFHNQIKTKYDAPLVLEELNFYRDKSGCMEDREKLLKLMIENVDYEKNKDKKYK
jgi:hypothetical protein